MQGRIRDFALPPGQIDGRYKSKVLEGLNLNEQDFLDYDVPGPGFDRRSGRTPPAYNLTSHRILNNEIPHL